MRSMMRWLLRSGGFGACLAALVPGSLHEGVEGEIMSGSPWPGEELWCGSPASVVDVVLLVLQLLAIGGLWELGCAVLLPLRFSPCCRFCCLWDTTGLVALWTARGDEWCQCPRPALGLALLRQVPNLGHAALLCSLRLCTLAPPLQTW